MYSQNKLDSTTFYISNIKKNPVFNFSKDTEEGLNSQTATLKFWNDHGRRGSDGSHCPDDLFLLDDSLKKILKEHHALLRNYNPYHYPFSYTNYNNNNSNNYKNFSGKNGSSGGEETFVKKGEIILKTTTTNPYTYKTFTTTGPEDQHRSTSNESLDNYPSLILTSDPFESNNNTNRRITKNHRKSYSSPLIRLTSSSSFSETMDDEKTNVNNNNNNNNTINNKAYSNFQDNGESKNERMLDLPQQQQQQQQTTLSPPPSPPSTLKMSKKVKTPKTPNIKLCHLKKNKKISATTPIPTTKPTKSTKSAVTTTLKLYTQKFYFYGLNENLKIKALKNGLKILSMAQQPKKGLSISYGGRNRRNETKPSVVEEVLPEKLGKCRLVLRCRHRRRRPSLSKEEKEEVKNGRSRISTTTTTTTSSSSPNSLLNFNDKITSRTIITTLTNNNSTNDNLLPKNYKNSSYRMKTTITTTTTTTTTTNTTTTTTTNLNKSISKINKSISQIDHTKDPLLNHSTLDIPHQNHPNMTNKDTQSESLNKSTYYFKNIDDDDNHNTTNLGIKKDNVKIDQGVFDLQTKNEELMINHPSRNDEDIIKLNSHTTINDVNKTIAINNNNKNTMNSTIQMENDHINVIDKNHNNHNKINPFYPSKESLIDKNHFYSDTASSLLDSSSPKTEQAKVKISVEEEEDKESIASKTLNGEETGPTAAHQPKQAQPINYIFGYGSLINPESRGHTVDSTLKARSIPVMVKGLTRAWNYNCRNTYTAVGVSRVDDPNVTCNGVLIPLEDPTMDLPKMDQREIGYRRVQLSREQIKIISPSLSSSFSSTTTSTTTTTTPSLAKIFSDLKCPCQSNSPSHGEDQNSDLSSLQHQLALTELNQLINKNAHPNTNGQGQVPSSSVSTVADSKDSSSITTTPPTPSPYEIAENSIIWVYEIVQDYFKPTKEIPISQIYIDCILIGCLKEGGLAFAQNFIESTLGWNTSAWINDRYSKYYQSRIPCCVVDTNEKVKHLLDTLLNVCLPHDFLHRTQAMK